MLSLDVISLRQKIKLSLLDSICVFPKNHVEPAQPDVETANKHRNVTFDNHLTHQKYRIRALIKFISELFASRTRQMDQRRLNSREGSIRKLKITVFQSIHPVARLCIEEVWCGCIRWLYMVCLFVFARVSVCLYLYLCLCLSQYCSVRANVFVCV